MRVTLLQTRPGVVTLRRSLWPNVIEPRSPSSKRSAPEPRSLSPKESQEPTWLFPDEPEPPFVQSLNELETEDRNGDSQDSNIQKRNGGLTWRCCEYCGKEFHQKDANRALYRHKRQEPGCPAMPEEDKISFLQKPESDQRKCDHCGKIFSKYRYESHIRALNKERKCEKCGKDFSPSKFKDVRNAGVSLRNHRARCKGPKTKKPRKTFKCEFCGKTCWYPKQLEEHLESCEERQYQLCDDPVAERIRVANEKFMASIGCPSVKMEAGDPLQEH